MFKNATLLISGLWPPKSPSVQLSFTKCTCIYTATSMPYTSYVYVHIYRHDISIHVCSVQNAYGRPKQMSYTIHMWTNASHLSLRSYRMYKLNAGKVRTHTQRYVYVGGLVLHFSTPFQFAIQQIILYPEMHKINLHLTRSSFCVPLKSINRFACFLWVPLQPRRTHACKYVLILCTYTHLLIDVTRVATRNSLISI